MLGEGRAGDAGPAKRGTCVLENIHPVNAFASEPEPTGW